MTILSLELLVFTATMYALYTLRKKFPDLFFLPAGVTVFLPPEDEDLKYIKEYNKQQQKKAQKGKTVSIIFKAN